MTLKYLNIVVPTKELNNALSFANSIVEKRNVIEELNNIKISTSNNLLELMVTDMDMSLNQKIGANILQEGEITVSTTMLSKIVRKILDPEITLQENVGSAQLKIIGKNCVFDLPTLPAAHFPLMEDIKSEIHLKIPCKDLAKIIEYTQFAISLEETRYNLNGIYLHTTNKMFASAATDGHRLSVARVPIDIDVADFGIILPRKTVGEILKIISDEKNILSNIEIFLSVNKIKFVCNNIVMISKLIDGTFPEYGNFIPVNNKNKFTVNAKFLATAIERVSTVTDERFKAIKMKLNKEGADISASGEAKGASQEVLNSSREKNNFCQFEGDIDIVIGFNPKYLLDVLSIAKQEIVELYFHDSFSPVLLKIVGNVDDSFVIMPVKV